MKGLAWGFVFADYAGGVYIGDGFNRIIGSVAVERLIGVVVAIVGSGGMDDKRVGSVVMRVDNEFVFVK